MSNPKDVLRGVIEGSIFGSKLHAKELVSIVVADRFVSVDYWSQSNKLARYLFPKSHAWEGGRPQLRRSLGSCRMSFEVLCTDGEVRLFVNFFRYLSDSVFSKEVFGRVEVPPDHIYFEEAVNVGAFSVSTLVEKLGITTHPLNEAFV